MFLARLGLVYWTNHCQNLAFIWSYRLGFAATLKTWMMREYLLGSNINFGRSQS